MEGHRPGRVPGNVSETPANHQDTDIHPARVTAPFRQDHTPRTSVASPSELSHRQTVPFSRVHSDSNLTVPQIPIVESCEERPTEGNVVTPGGNARRFSPEAIARLRKRLGLHALPPEASVSNASIGDFGQGSFSDLPHGAGGVELPGVEVTADGASPSGRREHRDRPFRRVRRFANGGRPLQESGFSFSEHRERASTEPSGNAEELGGDHVEYAEPHELDQPQVKAGGEAGDRAQAEVDSVAVQTTSLRAVGDGRAAARKDTTHNAEQNFNFRTFVKTEEPGQGSWYDIHRAHGNVPVDQARVVVFGWTNHNGSDQYKAMSDCISSFDLGGKEGVLLLEGLPRGEVPDEKWGVRNIFPVQSNIRIQGWDNPELRRQNELIGHDLLRAAQEYEKARGHASQGQLKELNDKTLAKLAKFEAAAEARDPELLGSVKDVRASDPNKIIFVGVGQGHIDHPGFIEALGEHDFIVLEVNPASATGGNGS